MFFVILDYENGWQRGLSAFTQNYTQTVIDCGDNK